MVQSVCADRQSVRNTSCGHISVKFVKRGAGEQHQTVHPTVKLLLMCVRRNPLDVFRVRYWGTVFQSAGEFRERDYGSRLHVVDISTFGMCILRRTRAWRLATEVMARALLRGAHWFYYAAITFLQTLDIPLSGKKRVRIGQDIYRKICGRGLA